MNDANVKQKYQEMLDVLKTQRDELNVKMHLASMELQDEWRTLEDKWQHFQSNTRQVEKQIGSSSNDIGSALSLLGEELKRGYHRIRKAYS